jgi:hypothetical protein
MKSRLILYLEKQAQATSGYGYPGHAIQSFIPVSQKREFSNEEEEKIEEGESQWLPKIFKSYQTPAHELLASPWRQSLLYGLPAGAVGALMGSSLGGGDVGNSTGAGIGAAVGGVGLGGIAGLLSYFNRKARNQDIKSLMSRLPPNATYRDLMSDPAYQADRDRANALQSAMILSGTIAGGRR